MNKIPEIIRSMACYHNVEVCRDTVNCESNHGACAGRIIWLGEFDDPDIELVAFFHELGHVLSNEIVLKRGSVMTHLSGEGLAWELGFGIAFDYGYTYDYGSKEMKYARKCFMTYFHCDATKSDIKEWEEENE